MAGFKDAYVPVFTAVQDALNKLQGLQQVILGKNLKQIDTLDNLPIAIINTDVAKVAAIDGVCGYQLQVPIVLDVIIVEYEAENWFDKMSTVMSEIVDALLADVTLGGKLQDLAWTSFAPGTITFQDVTYYGGEIRFMATLNFALS
jgi:hypothetical protein